MVIREVDTSPFYLKIDGKWVYVDEALIKSHPGGSAITTYRNKDASAVFHTFHLGSKNAYKLLQDLKEKNPNLEPQLPPTKV